MQGIVAAVEKVQTADHVILKACLLPRIYTQQSDINRNLAGEISIQLQEVIQDHPELSFSLTKQKSHTYLNFFLRRRLFMVNDTSVT